jgi:hypothetical protein
MMDAKTNDVMAAELLKEHGRSEHSEQREGPKSSKSNHESDRQKRVNVGNVTGNIMQKEKGWYL